MSPTIAIVRPANGSAVSARSPACSWRRKCRRRVKASSRAWVGCSWVPSPALTIWAFVHCEACSGAPEALCRMTIASTPIAATVSTVSRSDSPLETEDPLAEMLITSADSHLPAISKLDRVRVESSKNRFTTVRPRSAGSFLTGRLATSAICSARSKIEVAVGRSTSAADNRWRIRCSPRTIRTSFTPSVSASRTRTRSSAAVGRFLPTWSARIGSSRWPRSIRTASRTTRGRPRSPRASRAARTVRPENSTSSTSTTVASSTPAGSRVCPTVRVGLRRRSSRYIVTSSAPIGIAREPSGSSGCSATAIARASRSANGTPRLGMPASTSPSAPRLASRIWWAIRVSAREMSSASSTNRSVGSGSGTLPPPASGCIGETCSGRGR